MDIVATSRLVHEALPMRRSRTPLEAARLLGACPCAFEGDWYGAAVPGVPRFLLALDPEDLHFAVSWAQKVDYDGSHRCGDFVEGLWERDVIEIFLGEDGTERYQEFNLSPAGAWWTALFDGYRKRVEPVELGELGEPVEPVVDVTAGVRMLARFDGSGPRAVLSIPRRSLAVTIAFDESSRANVTAIVGGRVRRFLTWGSPGPGAPDFHDGAMRIPFAFFE